MRTGLVWFILGVVLIWVVPEATGRGDRYIFDDQTQQWVPAEQAEKKPEGAVGYAQELINKGKHRKAEKVLKGYIESNEDASDRAAAMLMYADCAFMRGRYYKAHERYQRVIDQYPGTDEFAMALRRELDIARAWLDGTKRRVLAVFRVEACDEAIDVLGQIEELGVGHRIAEVALVVKADYYFRTGEFELAELHYRRLAKDMQSQRYMKMAMFRSASSALGRFPGIWFDDTGLLEAEQLYSEYLDRFPEDARKDDVQAMLKNIAEKRAEKEYQIGRFYVRIDRPEAAARYFRYVVETWPDTLWAQLSGSQIQSLGPGSQHGSATQ